MGDPQICVDCQVADASPVAAPGQKGLQILINMKIVLHKRKCAMVRRRLRRGNLIFLCILLINSVLLNVIYY